MEIIHEKKFLRKPFLLNHHKCLGANQGMFWKEETKGYVIMKFKIGGTKVDI